MMQMVNACQNGDSHLLTSHYGQVRLSPEGLKFSLDCPGDRNPSFAFVPFLWLVYAFCMGEIHFGPSNSFLPFELEGSCFS